MRSPEPLRIPFNTRSANHDGQSSQRSATFMLLRTRRFGTRCFSCAWWFAQSLCAPGVLGGSFRFVLLSVSPVVQEALDHRRLPGLFQEEAVVSVGRVDEVQLDVLPQCTECGPDLLRAGGR